MGWDSAAIGVLVLPSGRLVRGRGLKFGLPPGNLPEFGVYLQHRRPPTSAWPSRWVEWRDWWLPADPDGLRSALRELWERAPKERVEVACTAGRGRTGTALACLAVLDGVPPEEARRFVRTHYHPRAVETPWQAEFVRRFRP